jgi:hypothetical protein
MSESQEFDVFVCDEDQLPVSGAKVGVQWGIWYGFEHKYTDADGHVQFAIPDCPINGRASRVTISVNSDDVGEYNVEDGESITVTV